MLKSMASLVSRNVGRHSAYLNSSGFRHFRATSMANTTPGPHDLRFMIKPNRFHKFVLIMGGGYKHLADIPERVSPQTLKKAFDVFRGRSLFVALGIAFTSAFILINTGRHYGMSISSLGAAKENEWKEKGRLEREAAAAAAVMKSDSQQ